MTEPNEPTATVSDADTYSAADAVAELHQEIPSGDVDEPTIEESEAPDDTDEADAEEDSDGDDPDSTEEDADDVPSLSDEVLATLQEHNPDAIKRWNDAWKGIIKRETRVGAYEAEINRLASSNIEDVKAEVGRTLEKLAEHHGVPLSELIGQPTQAATDDDSSELEDPVDNERRLESRLNAMERKLAEQETQRVAQEQAAKQDARLNDFVESNIGKVARKIKESYFGFEVSKAQLKAAILASPNEPDLLKAVKRSLVDELLVHSTKAARTSGAKVPEMLPKTGARGQSIVSGEDYTAAHAIAELRNRKS